CSPACEASSCAGSSCAVTTSSRTCLSCTIASGGCAPSWRGRTTISTSSRAIATAAARPPRAATGSCASPLRGNPELSHEKAGLSIALRCRRTLAAVIEQPTDLQMIRGTKTVLDLLAAKWSVDVVYLLANGTRRYSEVFYEVGEISKKTLTQTLRSLERDGVIARRVYAEVPARVEYSLTPLGWSLTGPLMAMYEWAAEHLGDVEAARVAENGAPPAPPALAAA